MKLFDLHCDTVTVLEKSKKDLLSGETQVSLRCLDSFESWVQTFAIFVPDDCRGREAEDYFDRNYDYLIRLLELHGDHLWMVRSQDDIRIATAKGRCAAILAVEGAACLGGRLEAVAPLAHRGVKMMTLTWNGENELASGHDTDKGFTSFGREAVGLMERHGILVDVSHLNDRGFEELTGFATKPFLATHSNSRAVCSHRRNLTDQQFCYIAQHGGIVGLNLCESFLSDDPQEVPGNYDMLLRHVYHMLELGGEDAIACGSDFDGAQIHPSLDTPQKLGGFGEFMVHNGISQEVADKIMFHNANRFLSKHMG